MKIDMMVTMCVTLDVTIDDDAYDLKSYVIFLVRL